MFTIKRVVYPKKIADRLDQLRHIRSGADANAVGTEANYSCGSFVRFSMSIDVDRACVADARFESNGCGFMLTAADSLAESVVNRPLADLHGLADAELRAIIDHAVDEIPSGRRECVDACINALHTAFADFRSRRIEEFIGEKPLICTCFGVTEEAVEQIITERSPQTVEDVGHACNAGHGCGSCRMLIQEMLDNRTVLTTKKGRDKV